MKPCSTVARRSFAVAKTFHSARGWLKVLLEASSAAAACNSRFGRLILWPNYGWDDNPNAWFLFMAMAQLLFSVACEIRDWLTFWSPSSIVCELALTYYFARESFTAKLTSITKRTRVIELKNIFARPSLEFSRYSDFPNSRLDFTA